MNLLIKQRSQYLRQLKHRTYFRDYRNYLNDCTSTQCCLADQDHLSFNNFHNRINHYEVRECDRRSSSSLVKVGVIVIIINIITFMKLYH